MSTQVCTPGEDRLMHLDRIQLDIIDEFTMCEEVVLLSFVDKHHPTFGASGPFLHLEKQIRME